MGEIVKNSVTAFRWPNATATCPHGTKINGGGGRCVYLGPYGTGWVYLRWSYPRNNMQWEVGCDTPVSQNVTAEVFAVCRKDEITATYNEHY